MTNRRINLTYFLLCVALVIATGWAAHAVGTQPLYLAPAIRDTVRPPSTYINAYVLSTDSAVTVTVPTFTSNARDSDIAIFSATCTDFYVSITGTAAAPGGNVTDGTASERDPTAYRLAQGSTFSLVAHESCTVTVAYYLGGF